MLAIGKEDAKYFNWLVHLGYICKSIVTNQVYVGNLHKLCVIYGSYLLSYTWHQKCDLILCVWICKLSKSGITFLNCKVMAIIKVHTFWLLDK